MMRISFKLMQAWMLRQRSQGLGRALTQGKELEANLYGDVCQREFVREGNDEEL